MGAGKSTGRSSARLPPGAKAAHGSSKNGRKMIVLRKISGQASNLGETPGAISASPNIKDPLPSKAGLRGRLIPRQLSAIIGRVKNTLLRKTVRSETATSQGAEGHETSGTTHVARRVKHYPDLRNDKSVDGGGYHTVVTLPRYVGCSGLISSWLD